MLKNMVIFLTFEKRGVNIALHHEGGGQNSKYHTYQYRGSTPLPPGPLYQSKREKWLVVQMIFLVLVVCQLQCIISFVHSYHDHLQTFCASQEYS